MSCKTVSRIMLSLLLASMLAGAFSVPPVKAGGTIYIRADGSVDPSTALISSNDNITYTLIGNIYDSIQVERSNIIVDGNNFTVQGFGSGAGFALKATNNVTIKKTTIRNFSTGLVLGHGSYSNSICENNITANNGTGIFIDHSSSNTFSGNNITANNWDGVILSYSSDNSICGNRITNNREGIYLYSSSSNTLTENTITANRLCGIFLDSSSSNTFSGNNITANSFDGLWLVSSSSNTLTGNTITANGIDGFFIIGSSSNTLAGNNITANSDGVFLASSSSNTLTENNIAANDFYGIVLDYSSGNTLAGNTISANNWAGLWLYSHSSSNTLTGNNITNNWAGLWLYDSSSGNTISGNNITENYYGLDLEASDHNSISGNSFLSDGLHVYNSYQNVVNDNLVNGKPLVYLEDESNIAVENAGQVILINCTNMRLENLDLSNAGPGVELIGTSDTVITGSNVTNNSRGIELYISSNITLTRNNITANNEDGIYLSSSSSNAFSGNNITANSWDGVHLESSSSNTVTGNTITANNGFGIFLASSSSNALTGNTITDNGYGICLNSPYLHQSSKNTLTGNNIADNGYGIYLLYPSDNKLYHNNFINNNIQAGGSTNDYNTWDAGYLFGGNYWSDYTGTDLNNDGVGDTPYVIDAYNLDRYPLMHPWSSLPVHNTNTGLGYTRIQEAINAPETLDGHTIFVEAGTYYENVVVNKTISLVGEDMRNTIIDGNYTGAVVSIASDNVKLNGFQIQHSGWGWSGILFVNSTSNVLTDNIVRDNYYGIYLSYSFNNIIYHNNILYNRNQAHVTTGYPNTWDNGSEGNFWSDYVGWDSNGDGVGDVPYIIDSNNQDNYPLVSPSWYWRNPMLGDVNKDMKVDGRDIAVVARAFASYQTHPRWNQSADLNQDNKIDGKDMALVARNFGRKYS